MARPNPRNLPTRGIIGVDIILDKLGNQVAWRTDTIWPGPNVDCRFNDPSWPDDFRRYVKETDHRTGVQYWVRPYTGTVQGGQWSPF
jgi:hypothetical protein